MKKNYIVTLIALLLAGVVHGQIQQATDINTSGNSNIADPYAYNGELYFEADDGLGVIGDELYKLSPDGTVVLLKDINQDPDDSSPNGDPGNFMEYKGLLYFNGNMGDATLNGKELWVTDGTEAGTQEVFDLQPGAGNDGNPNGLFVFNGNLYFQANDGSSTQWWKYDGTNDPVKVTTIRGDSYASPSNPIIDAANNRVFFQAITDIGRIQLHVMDAQENITEIQTNDSNHGYTGSEAILYNGSLIFQGDDGTNGDELWISDGTLAGTSMLLNIDGGTGNSDPEEFAVYNDKVYFAVDPGTGTQLWVTDGTTAGTQQVLEPNVGGEGSVEGLTVYNGKLYFTADDGVNGAELWVYDGTTAMMLKDINLTAGTGSDPAGYFEAHGILFFEADDGTGVQLWMTNGTADGTVLVSSVFADSETPMDVNADEFVYTAPWFLLTGDDAAGDDIFVLDVRTITSGAKQATDINTSGNSNIADPYVYNGELYFEADDGLGVIGDEFYKLGPDGTVVLLKDINQDPDDSSPNGDPGNFMEYKGLLYFNGNMGDATLNGKELWVTDGTEAGTQEVFDLQPGAGNDGNPNGLFVFNGNLYFQANDGSSTQWWKYDGTNDPVKVTTIRGDSYASPSNPIIDAANNRVFFQAITDIGRIQLHVMDAQENITEIQTNDSNHGYTGSEAILYNGSLIFQGDDGTNGDELWISDGTLAGTSMILNIDGGTGNSDPEEFAVYNDKVYFAVNPGTGTQLWVTDGTTAGTLQVLEPNVGGEGSVEGLTVYNGKLYFTADDGANGAELWVYDGTTAMMLKDINLTAGIGSDPIGFTEVDGLLFFEADDGTGVKLWVTNGMPEYTMTVASAQNSIVDPLDVNSDEFAVIGTELYYTADDAAGDDIFMVDAQKIFSYDVIFMVTDNDGPVEGAEVAIAGDTLMTDASGAVTFEWVRIGNNLEYTINKNGYLETAGTVTVLDEAVMLDETLTLEPTYDVTFSVTDGANPLEGAEVLFNGASAITDASGNAIFTGLKAESGLAYSVTLSGYGDVAGTIDVVDADVTEDVTLILTVYDVTFNVTDGTNALAGAEVAFNGATATTDAAGAATFADVAPATGMAYTVTLAGYEEATGTVDVVDADVTENVALTMLVYDVTFNITDGTNALAGAEVAFNGATATTDATGAATFADVAPATGMAYTVTLAGYEEATGAVDVVDADVTEDVSLTLITYSVTFNVTDGSGAVEGASVTFNGATQTTDAAGSAVFAGVEPQTGLDYIVTMADYEDATGTVDVDGDEVVDVTLQPTSVFNRTARELIVYPNPSRGLIHVDGLLTGESYEVYSMNQTLVRAGNVDNNTLKLELEPGLYILKVDSDGQTMVKRLIIQ